MPLNRTDDGFSDSLEALKTKGPKWAFIDMPPFSDVSDLAKKFRMFCR